MNSRKLRVLFYAILLLPLDLIVATCLILVSAVAAVSDRRFFRATENQSGGRRPALQRDRATIQILNWDGKHLLEECLPSVIEAVQATAGNHTIVVVDNGSTDGSAEFVRSRFPEVRVLQLDRNYGFVGGNNRGVQQVDTDIVVLLNNDMIVDQGFLTPLLDGFTDERVFAVTSQIFFEDRGRRREETGKTRANFENGFFYLWHADIEPADEIKKAVPVFWAGGGSCAFDRRKFEEIGGFDSLYHPFYVEDADLSYQAWKRGWRCLLAPASRVVHKHRATTSRKYTTRFVENTTRRNLYLFLWKNLTDRRMLVNHITNLPRIHGRAMLSGEVSFEVRAYLRAVLRLPLTMLRRIRSVRRSVISDSAVLERSQA